MRGHPVAADVVLATCRGRRGCGLTVLLPTDLRPDGWCSPSRQSVAGAVPVALRRLAPWFAVVLAVVLFATPDVVGGLVFAAADAASAPA
jgi:hypothetical protein